MLKISDIRIIKKHPSKGGYAIEFKDGRIIHLTKRRTIPALLVLIKEGEGCEADLAQGNEVIPDIRKELGDRLPSAWVQDFYGDANKPFSELWNEEGFTFIDNLKGDRKGRSQAYVLKPEDHEKLFGPVRKAHRRAPVVKERDTLRGKHGGSCNICGTTLVRRKDLAATTFAKDRKREVFDHRVPVEKGGTSDVENFQPLCFFCNKSKWQICNVCAEEGCEACALAYPETSTVVKPTGEDISDRMADRASLDE